MKDADFLVQDHGSICILSPQTDGAMDWVEDNIEQDNDYQPYWPAVVIEPRYMSDILDGITADGMTLA